MNQNRNGTNGEAADAFTETIRLTAPGSNDLFSITGTPAVSTAGNVEPFTITVLSPNGGIDTSYHGTVHFTSSDPKAQFPPNFTFTLANAGVKTLNFAFETSGIQSITVD